MVDLVELKEALRPAYHRVRTAEGWLRYWLGLAQPERKLTADAHRFWNESSGKTSQVSHWRGAGIFADDERWLSLGAAHLDLYGLFTRMLGETPDLHRVVEWGCGGGANAVHFAPLAGEFIGIEVSPESLAECARQLAKVAAANFRPILIDTAMPDAARSQVPGPCDLFLSTYVFELLPTPEYGLRVLAIAFDLLADGGLAIIQVKFARDNWSSRPKRFGYRYNFPSMTTYRIEEFWDRARDIGFLPHAVKLVPEAPLNQNGDYAYFLLQKPKPQ
jgi:SAM-dependent methyltransferase